MAEAIGKKPFHSRHDKEQSLYDNKTNEPHSQAPGLVTHGAFLMSSYPKEMLKLIDKF